MELDVLHRSTSPEIVEFYGAFFIESCVYYCMEYMDAGSLDRLEGAGVPEDVLARIARAMVCGLKFLKDHLQVIHRGPSQSTSLSIPERLFCPTTTIIDVKPTNVLVNRQGAIKLCDFGVSGQLNKSIARTHIGCQSYMAVCLFLSLGLDPPTESIFSLNESKGNPKTRRWPTPSRPTSGPSVSPLSRSRWARFRTRRRHTPTSLLS